MTDRPKRIQRKRTKGWRMPENVVYVGRGTRWGNPFFVLTPKTADDRHRLHFYADFTRNVDLWRSWPVASREIAVQAYREMVAPCLTRDDWRDLIGRDLACWCPLDQPCHADVLLELANQEPT